MEQSVKGMLEDALDQMLVLSSAYGTANVSVEDLLENEEVIEVIAVYQALNKAKEAGE